MGRRITGLGNISDMHPDPVIRQAHPIWHRRGHITLARFQRGFRRGIIVHHFAKLILNPAILVGILVHHHFGDPIGARTGPAAFNTGRHITPTDFPPSPLDSGDLITQIDLQGYLTCPPIIIPLEHGGLGPHRLRRRSEKTRTQEKRTQ